MVGSSSQMNESYTIQFDYSVYDVKPDGGATLQVPARRRLAPRSRAASPSVCAPCRTRRALSPSLWPRLLRLAPRASPAWPPPPPPPPPPPQFNCTKFMLDDITETEWDQKTSEMWQVLSDVLLNPYTSSFLVDINPDGSVKQMHTDEVHRQIVNHLHDYNLLPLHLSTAFVVQVGDRPDASGCNTADGCYSGTYDCIGAAFNAQPGASGNVNATVWMPCASWGAEGPSAPACAGEGDATSGFDVGNSELCEPINERHWPEVAGKVVVADRGSCEFVTKIMHAQQAGALGLVVVNNVEDQAVIQMAASNSSGIRIPSIMISKADGDEMRANVRAMKRPRAVRRPRPCARHTPGR